MQFSSTSPQYPSTPAFTRSSSTRNYTHKPMNSSPLASSPASPKSSPVAAAQARRRLQYKSRTPSTPLPRGPTWSSSKLARSSGGNLFKNDIRAFGIASEDQQKFLRDKFRERCFEQASKARQRSVTGRRHASTSEASSDVPDEAMDDDEEEDDETIMQDELFRRIMANVSRKEEHAYRVSYSQQVGSSFDPDLEDVSRWEKELVGQEEQGHQCELTAAELEELELQEYAEECTRRAAQGEDDDFDWRAFADASNLPPVDDDVEMGCEFEELIRRVRG